MIGIIKAPGEAAEKLRHRKIRFRVPDIDRGIDKNRPPVGICHIVSRPEIPVQDRRKRRLREKVGKARKECFNLFPCGRIKAGRKPNRRDAIRERSQ